MHRRRRSDSARHRACPERALALSCRWRSSPVPIAGWAWNSAPPGTLRRRLAGDRMLPAILRLRPICLPAAVREVGEARRHEHRRRDRRRPSDWSAATSTSSSAMPASLASRASVLSPVTQADSDQRHAHQRAGADADLGRALPSTFGRAERLLHLSSRMGSIAAMSNAGSALIERARRR